MRRQPKALAVLLMPLLGLLRHAAFEVAVSEPCHVTPASTRECIPMFTGEASKDDAPLRISTD